MEQDLMIREHNGVTTDLPKELYAWKTKYDWVLCETKLESIPCGFVGVYKLVVVKQKSIKHELEPIKENN